MPIPKKRLKKGLSVACIVANLFFGFVTGYFSRLQAELLATHCIDTQHVHVAGFSTGGVLAYELGATVPGVASVAAVEAGQMLGFGSAYY